MFKINDVEWNILYVNPNSECLMRSDGTITLGVTDWNKRTVYLSNSLSGREIDFVTSFERNWEALREILGISRAIRKQPGTILKSKYAEGTLESGTVAEGDVIPRTHYAVKEKPYSEITLEKYAKEVSVEAIKD